MGKDERRIRREMEKKSAMVRMSPSELKARKEALMWLVLTLIVGMVIGAAGMFLFFLRMGI